MKYQAENKICQNCKNDFTIEPDDFSFYEKIKMPPPTFCPECRLQRRLAWRNERGLYRRLNNVPGKENEQIISTYPNNIPVKVFDNEYFWSDAWDAIDSGMDYDFSRPFFEQFKELLYKTPLISFFDSKGLNNKYCNYITESKNCYMLSAVWSCEDCIFGNRNSFCKQTVDCYVCHKTEFAYSNIYCGESYKLFYSEHSYNCTDSYFLYDCRNCVDCFMCYGLRNKSYCIENVQYSQEEYKEKMKEINLGNYEVVFNLKKYFKEFKKNAIRKYANNTKCVNVTGDNIENAKNAQYCFDLPGGIENIKYCNWGTYGLKDSYDTGPGTGGKSELTYEGVSIGVANSNCYFGTVVWNCNDVEYAFNTYSSKNCFGVVSLKTKQYCILNKQYSKEEYFEMLEKIKKHMDEMPYVDSKGRVYKYGEFFPIELSPYSYNGSTVQDFFPLSKEIAENEGFNWQEETERNYTITINHEEIPLDIKDANDLILSENIECANNKSNIEGCTKVFRLIPNEFNFYKRFNIPIPHLCPNCRHGERIKERNPMKLWHRKCMKDGCENEFETSYAPDRPEIVYCEKCYQQEVY